MANENNIIGNTTTIINYIATMLAGYTVSALIAHGINLPVDVTGLANIFGIILGLIFGYINSLYPNTFKFLNNHVKPVTNESEPNLNDKYVAGEYDDEQ